MTVRREQRRNRKTGAVREFLMISFTFRHPDGQKQRIRRVAQSMNMRLAEVEEHAILRSLLDGTFGREEETEKNKMPTVSGFEDTFIDLYARPNNKPSEVQSKRNIFRLYLVPFLGELRLDEVGTLEIDQFKAELLGNGLAPKTVTNILAVLSKMLRYAVDVALLDQAPRIKFPKCPAPEFDFFDFGEAERLLDAAVQRAPEWYLPILLALRTGLRRGELYELRWGDIDLTAGRLRVARSISWGHIGPTKTDTARTIPLAPATVAAIRRHRHLRGELVLAGPVGRHVPENTSDANLRRVCRLAGLREVGWHVLRHTFASHLVMKGVPLKHIQELLGHKTIQMTLRYAHLAPDSMAEAVAVLDEPVPSDGNQVATEEH
jgi:integrase